MFDIGWQEIFVIAVLALIVVGPKDLPHAVRTITQWIQRARAMAREFQGGVNEMVREAELDDIRKQISEAKDMGREIGNDVNSDSKIAKSLGLGDDFDGDFASEEASIDAARPVPIAATATAKPETSSATGVAADSATGVAEDDDIMPIAPVTTSKEQGA